MTRMHTIIARHSKRAKRRAFNETGAPLAYGENKKNGFLIEISFLPAKWNANATFAAGVENRMGPARTITVGNCSRAIDVHTGCPDKNYLAYPPTFISICPGREEKEGNESYRVRITVSIGNGALIRGSIAFSRANWDEKLVLHGGEKGRGLNTPVHGAFQSAEKCISIIGSCTRLVQPRTMAISA